MTSPGSYDIVRVQGAESVGFEAGVVDELVLRLPSEGAELHLYTTKLELPPCPRMRAIVSERRGLELQIQAPIPSAVFARTPTSRAGC